MKKSTLLLLILFVSGSLHAITVVDFSFTGSDQSWEVPDAVTSVSFVVLGAKGGDFNDPDANAFKDYSGFGGNGHLLNGTLSVVPGDLLIIRVGGEGGLGDGSQTGGGGFGGGGDGGPPNAGVAGGSGGGGYSGVFWGASPLIIAGGGGGGPWGGDASTTSLDGGTGGGPVPSITGGGGGTSTMGGSVGFGDGGGGLPSALAGSSLTGGSGGGGSEVGDFGPEGYGGAGGGGGYFGGGGGQGGDSRPSSGGAGSGFIDSGVVPDFTIGTADYSSTGGDGFISFTYGVIPEPSSAALWLALLSLGVVSLRWRR